MALIDGFMSSLQERLHGRDWPPEGIADQWDAIEFYRTRFENDRQRLIQGDTRWHATPRSMGGTGVEDEIYTPVPIAYEMGRLSSALLFSEQMDITHPSLQQEIDDIRDLVDFDAFFLESGEYAAVEGSVGIRVIQDDEISDLPILSFVHGDQVLWDVRYGHYTRGGVVVTERQQGRGPGQPVFRLAEEHGKGFVERTLYKGTATRRGEPVPLSALEEFAELPEFEETGLDVSTLVRWDNVPGGRSDLFAHLGLLERIDEVESLFLDKGRKSVPFVFGDKALADDDGVVRRTGMIMTGGRMASEMGEEGKGRIEVVQPGLQAEDHKTWAFHLLDLALTTTGYSLATWGRDPSGGAADSGKALKLRQTRTLLNRAGKDRMARGAIKQAVGIALALAGGAREVKEFLPNIKLGDGLPEDPIETAQELQMLKAAGLISQHEGLARLHPDWDEEAIEQEIARIGSSSSEASQALASSATGAPRKGALDAILNGARTTTTTINPGDEQQPEENQPTG